MFSRRHDVGVQLLNVGLIIRRVTAAVADLRGGRNRRTPPLNVSQTAVKMVYKQFAGSSHINNWINDNQQLLVNSLINKTIHVSQSAILYCYTSLLDITLLHFA